MTSMLIRSILVILVYKSCGKNFLEMSIIPVCIYMVSFVIEIDIYYHIHCRAYRI